MIEASSTQDPSVTDNTATFELVLDICHFSELQDPDPAIEPLIIELMDSATATPLLLPEPTDSGTVRLQQSGSTSNCGEFSYTKTSGQTWIT